MKLKGRGQQIHSTLAFIIQGTAGNSDNREHYGQNGIYKTSYSDEWLETNFNIFFSSELKTFSSFFQTSQGFPDFPGENLPCFSG